MSLVDLAKLDIRDGAINYRLYQQDGSLVPMTVRDSFGMRQFVAWVQMHDRYTPQAEPPPLTVASIMALDLRPQMTPGGLRVYVHRQRIVKRSLRERFCTRPWRPWIASKVAPSIIGPDDCYRVGDQLHVGERAFDVLKKETAR